MNRYRMHLVAEAEGHPKFDITTTVEASNMSEALDNYDTNADGVPEFDPEDAVRLTIDIRYIGRAERRVPKAKTVSG